MPDGAAGDEPPKSPVRAAWVAGERTLEELAPALQPLAISLIDELVELYVFCPGGADVRSLPSPPVEIIRYSRPRWWSLGSWGVDQIASEVAERKVRLLHALDVNCAHLVARVAAEAKIDYVVSSYSLGDGRRLGRLDSRARAVLAASERVQQDLMGNRVASARRIHLMRPGVVRVSRAMCFDSPGKSVAIVAGGPMDDFGCFDAVLRTFAELKARRYDCVYFIIGQGRAERRLRARAESLALASELTFVERQPPWQMTGILKAADVYISPAPIHSVDFQSLLAMASGVPVLSIESPASDFLKDGRTTWQFRQGDASGLTKKLLSLLEDRAAAKGLAENALDYLRRYHAPVDVSARTAEIYRRAIAEGASEKNVKQQVF